MELLLRTGEAAAEAGSEVKHKLGCYCSRVWRAWAGAACGGDGSELVFGVVLQLGLIGMRVRPKQARPVSGSSGGGERRGGDGGIAVWPGKRRGCWLHSVLGIKSLDERQERPERLRRNGESPTRLG